MKSSVKTKNRKMSSFESSVKPGSGGADGITKIYNNFLKNKFKRKMVLNTPDEIRAANPDKHFAWVNYQRMKDYSGYHPNGYRALKVEHDPENMNQDNFGNSIDPYLHRKEMILAYIPRAEYEETQRGEAIARQMRQGNFTPSNNLKDMMFRNEHDAGKVDAETARSDYDSAMANSKAGEYASYNVGPLSHED